MTTTLTLDDDNCRCRINRVKYRELLRQLHEDGWRHDRTVGSHMMMTHPTKPGPVVVPAGGKTGQDVPRGTLNSILRQAGLK